MSGTAGSSSGEKGLSQKACAIAAGIEFAVFAFLLFFKVTEIPLPLNVDEAGMAYDAVSLAQYHCDRYLYRFPVYFVNFGGGQNALYTYLTALLVKLSGYSILTVRLPAILLSLISMAVFMHMIRKEHGSMAAITAGGLFCILPFSVMHSRWGLESYLLFPMLIFASAALYHSVRSFSIGWFFLSGCLFGISLYAYTVAYLLLPVFLGILFVYLLSVRRVSLRSLLVFAVPLILSAVPLLLMLAVNNGFLEEIRTRYFSVPRFPYYRAGEISFRHMISNLKFGSHNIFYNLFIYDFCQYNIIPKFGSMYYVSLPFILYGFLLSLRQAWKDLRNRTFSLDLMMTVLFFVTFLILLMFEGINMNRACAVYIPLIYFLTAGILRVISKWKISAVLFCLVYLVSFGCFLRYYFTEFPEIIKGDSMFASVEDIKEAITFADTVNHQDGTVYVLDSVQPYIYVLLSLETDPFTFNEKKIMSNDHFVKVFDKYRFRLDAVSPDCIYILNFKDRVPEELADGGFETKRFGSVDVYYQTAE